MIEETLGLSRAAYSRRFADPAFGQELAELLADRCGLPRPLVRKVEGSNLVYRAGEGPWLKICPPFWRDAFDAEVRVTEAVHGRLPAPIPAIVSSGELEDWRYLISTHVPGLQIQQVLPMLSEADLDRVAAELGQFMHAFHRIAIEGFARAAEPSDTRALHTSRGVDPGRVDQIVAFLAAQSPALRALGAPVLVHADLTAEHVMLAEKDGRWRLAGVLDLADSMMAPAELDLVAPFLELFRGKRALQRRLMAESGIAAPSGAFSETLMAVALQHRFMHFDDWFKAEIGAGVTDVPAIARAVFPD